MRHLEKALARLAAHTLRWRIRSDQLRVGSLKRLQFLNQTVKLRVTQFRRIQNVIQVLMATDLVAQILYLFLSARFAL
jgi:hypothetical protein